MIEFIFALLISIVILFFMIVMGVTLIGVITGNIGMVEEMMKFFKLTKR
jgi:hypothetical protein